MNWKRLNITSYLLLGRIGRFKWFWRYVVLRRPMALSVTFMVGAQNIYAGVFIESLVVESLKVAKRIDFRLEEELDTPLKGYGII